MPILEVEAKNIALSDSTTIHVDFLPKNTGIQNMVLHGAELDISSDTPEQAIEKYVPIARGELLKYLNTVFPGVFT